MNLIDLALKFLGKPYLWGGNSVFIGADCSGFLCEVLRSFGYIGREDYTAQGLYDHFKSHLCHELARGSLLFFGRSRNHISHIALAINDRLMVEAGGGDSTTTNVIEATKKNAYIRIRPIANRKDLVAIINLEGVKHETIID